MPINNNTNSLLLDLKQRYMPRNIFIREIILTENEPKLCPTCQKEDRLEKEVVYERRSDGKTIFCSRCEALIVMTNQNIKQVELEGVRDNQIMLKEPYLIRRVTY